MRQNKRLSRVFYKYYREDFMKKILVAILLVLFVSIVFYQTGFCRTNTGKGSAAQDLLIKSEVETAISMLQTIYLKYQKGDMTLDQAKQLGADLLRGLKYGKEEYFWADTTEGVNIVLYGNKEVEGKNRLEFQDYKGKFLIKDIIATAKAGGGYETYWFPKVNQTKPFPKKGYVQLFEPFGWVVGTGYYLTINKTEKKKAD
jgi:signal transduction histidine kinase